MSEPERIVATYEVRAPESEVAVLARRIAYEQTVELPFELVTDPDVCERVVGRVETIRPAASSSSGRDGEPAADGPPVHHAEISYTADLASGQLPQLLNLIYGNVSLYPGVRLVDFTLPSEVLDAFAGPRFGVAGLRRLTGVTGRPLLATALKPRGFSAAEYARMAGEFARGGGDLVKDDQNLVAPSLAAFRDHVTRCRDEVAEANARTGGSCLYFPLISAPLESIERQFEVVRALGLRGVLLCPAILGLDTCRALAARHDLVFMAHPSLTGGFTRGIATSLVFGTLFRLAGVDISVFPDVRGRFSFEGDTCAAIRGRLVAPLGAVAPAWPCPAGGLQFEGLQSACEEYGEDSILLVGGALQGHSPRLEDGTRAFAEKIAACFPAARRVAPDNHDEVETSAASGMGEHLPFHPDFRWEGREDSAYQRAERRSDDIASSTNDAPPWQGVRRVELVGKFGETSRSDLRYFEVEPGGHTRHEQHVHAHIIIGARGEGRLAIGERQVTLRPHDVAFVPPLAPHQLRNDDADEPFGFFCIVDHERD